MDNDGEQKPKSHAAGRGGNPVYPPDFPRLRVGPAGDAITGIEHSHADRCQCQCNDDPTHQTGHCTALPIKPAPTIAALFRYSRWRLVTAMNCTSAPVSRGDLAPRTFWVLIRGRVTACIKLPRLVGPPLPRRRCETNLQHDGEHPAHKTCLCLPLCLPSCAASEQT
jgi:hypothetical protein